MMLERIHVKNYKCLRDVTVELGDFTVLIGPNDSGKSSFLEVVKTLGNIGRPDAPLPFQGDHALNTVVWRKDPSLQIVFDVTGTAAGKSFRYHLKLPAAEGLPDETLEWDGRKVFWTEEAQAPPGYPAGTLVYAVATAQGKQLASVRAGHVLLRQLVSQRHPEATALQESLASTIEYHFDPGQLSRASVPTPDAVLEPSGGNLAAVLDVMQNSPDRLAFDAVQNSLHDSVPTISGFVLPPAAQPAGAKALQFILSGNGNPPVTIPASLASSGARLLTAFLTLSYAKTPGVLLFEEPENGLHPFRLQSVIDILRKMSRGDVGNRKRQIILTTHNPLLLNYAQPEEVRVFVRHPETGTCVVPMAQVPDIDRLLKEFSLGELWYLLGEEKLFQEQPA